MMFKTSYEYIGILLPFIVSFTDDIIQQLSFLKKKNNSVLISRLMTGKIKYKEPYFTGFIPKKVEKELLDKGAKKTSRGFYIKYEKLPQDIKRALVENKRETQAVKREIIKILQQTNDNISLSLISSSYIIKFIAMFYKHLQRLSTKKTQQKIQQDYMSMISDSISTTLTKTEQYISSQDFISSSDLISKTIHLLKYHIKDKILNATNKIMFDYQAEDCKDNGYKSFYWWHNPVKKPSDRQYHRKHFEDSKKGKKFYFNNLPTYQGEPDYPGKLWNCKCRAYVFWDEFKKKV